jgi:maltooligosyltrehalose trehalohydrolase
MWRVWAPRAKHVELVLFDRDGMRKIAMLRDESGHFSHTVADVPDGQRYAYRLNNDADRPDPCSLWQPRGIPGSSAFVKTESFRWTDQQWTGIPREDLVIYELHVGTFTSDGTFDAIIARLAALRELGVTALELMPIGQFPGTRNWGYDGVLPYAAQHSYGGPHGLQRLVDAAHAAGLAVILDVVYNHLGPEGCYLHEFGPYFTDKYKTPWGQAINYDERGCDGVRDWVLDNARMWLNEFHLDGLRLDAVHAIYDLGARHILMAIRDVADEVSREHRRTIHVIAESDLNDPRIVLSADRGGHGLSAQWSDDFHHAVHALLTGERRGYYADFGHVEQVGQAMFTPFVYAWDYSPHRGRKHGAPVPLDLPGDRFIVCIQNHDQVGNRAQGDRLNVLLGHPAKQRLAACLMLFSPYVPLLFMGEEYGETNAFPFFCSFCGDELIQAVRDGRKREFADFLSDGEQIPDPAAFDTFASARLSWSWPRGTLHEGIRNLYYDLLAARRQWPALGDFTRRKARLLPQAGGGSVLELVRGGGGGGDRADTAARGDDALAHDGHSSRTRAAIQIFFNLSDCAVPLPALDGGDSQYVTFASEWQRYGGARRPGADHMGELLPFECAAFGAPRIARPM